MTDDRTKRETPGRGRGANPFHNEVGRGAQESSPDVNPSGPSTGAEGWGIGPGEANTTGVPQGTLEKRPQHTEARRTDETGGPPAEREGIDRAGQKMGAGHSFRCADMGNADCRWEVRGRTADELLPQIEQHAREHHGGKSFDEQTRRKVHDAIRERAA